MITLTCRWLILLGFIALWSNPNFIAALPVLDDESHASTRSRVSGAVNAHPATRAINEKTNGGGNTLSNGNTNELPPSPADLLKPDRFQFYAYNDRGDMITRQMTAEEIQALIASGGTSQIAVEIHEPQKADDVPTGGKNVMDVVQKVQSVLKSAMDKPLAEMTGSVPTIPEQANAEWSNILPGILSSEPETINVNNNFSMKIPASSTAADRNDRTTTSSPTEEIYREKPMIPVPVITTEHEFSTRRPQTSESPVFQMLSVIPVDENSRKPLRTTTTVMTTMSPKTSTSSIRQPEEDLLQNVVGYRVPIPEPALVPVAKPASPTSSTVDNLSVVTSSESSPTEKTSAVSIETDSVESTSIISSPEDKINVTELSSISQTSQTIGSESTTTTPVYSTITFNKISVLSNENGTTSKSTSPATVENVENESSVASSELGLESSTPSVLIKTSVVESSVVTTINDYTEDMTKGTTLRSTLSSITTRDSTKEDITSATEPSTIATTEKANQHDTMESIPMDLSSSLSSVMNQVSETVPAILYGPYAPSSITDLPETNYSDSSLQGARIEEATSGIDTVSTNRDTEELQSTEIVTDAFTSNDATESTSEIVRVTEKEDKEEIDTMKLTDATTQESIVTEDNSEEKLKEATELLETTTSNVIVDPVAENATTVFTSDDNLIPIVQMNDTKYLSETEDNAAQNELALMLNTMSDVLKMNDSRLQPADAVSIINDILENVSAINQSEVLTAELLVPLTLPPITDANVAASNIASGLIAGFPSSTISPLTTNILKKEDEQITVVDKIIATATSATTPATTTPNVVTLRTTEKSEEKKVTEPPRQSTPTQQNLTEESVTTERIESSSLKVVLSSTTLQPSSVVPDASTEVKIEEGVSSKNYTQESIRLENSESNPTSLNPTFESTTKSITASVSDLEESVNVKEPLNVIVKNETRNSNENMRIDEVQEDTNDTKNLQEIRIRVNDTAVLVTKSSTNKPEETQPTLDTKDTVKDITTQQPQRHNASNVPIKNISTTTASTSLPMITEKETSDKLLKLEVPLRDPVPVATTTDKIVDITEDAKEKVQSSNSSVQADDEKWTLISHPKPDIAMQNRQPEVPLDALKSVHGLDVSVRNTSADIVNFSRLCNELAFSFWKATSLGLNNSRSLTLSPFGMVSLLAMIFLGARGPTSEQMNELLRLDDVATFNPHLIFQNVTDAVGLARGRGIANAAFVRELFADKLKVRKLMPFYKEQAQQFYEGLVAEVNFATIGDLVRRRTNLLIRKQTGGRIKDFVRANSVPLRSPLAALSANVFQTDCNSSRTSSSGRDGELYFAVSPAVRQRKLVPIPATVWRSGVLAGYEPSLDATAIALGGHDELVSTIFLLPGQQGHAAPGDNLDRLEQRLVAGSFRDGAWNKLLRILIPRNGLELQLPKFSHRSVINATSALKRMGLDELFSRDADLKGINGIGNRLHLTDVLQMNLFSTCGDENIGNGRHHIEIYPAYPTRNARRLTKIEERFKQTLKSDNAPVADEESMESVSLERTKRHPAASDRPRLKLDRPFLYFVRHNPTGLILHMGRFNPRLLP